MSVQICEGVWRNRCGQRLVILRCEPVEGQQWTDGLQHYSDDGTYCANNRGQDLVVFVGPLPDKSQQDRAAENERLQAEVEQLEGLNYRLSEALRDLQEGHTAMDHRAEAARLAFLDVIKTLLEMRR